MSLEEHRKRIDELDREIIRLINERTAVAMKIGKEKAAIGKPVFDAQREAQVFEKVVSLNTGPIGANALKGIYREIMSGNYALQRSVRIAYLGPKATFTHQAAVKQFGESMEYRPMTTINDVFAEVDKGEADYGVIPIENSAEGVVFHSLHSFDILVGSDLKIVAQIYLPITHNLISRSPLSDIKRVYSKDQAIAQCRGWLRRHVPQAETVDVSSTSEAVIIAGKEDGAAAIASSLAAAEHGVPIVGESIQDMNNNETRFLVIGHEKDCPGPVGHGNDKTSLVLSIPDESGSLQRCLEPFSRRNINLVKIESRPSRIKAWEYWFFVDVIGHIEDEPIKEVIAELEKICPIVKWLGSYPNLA
jgi:chorismate mutase / prephenate dehydratase